MCLNNICFLVFQMPEAASKGKEESQLGTFQNCENIYYSSFKLIPITNEKVKLDKFFIICYNKTSY